MTHKNDIPLVYEGILTDGPDVHLQGSFCAHCNKYHFPAQDNCTSCLGKTTLADMGSEATIHSVTTIRTRPPLGLPRPYSVAYVDLKDVPFRMFALMDPKAAGSYKIGQEVALSVGALGVNNQNEVCLRPYFSPQT